MSHPPVIQVRDLTLRYGSRIIQEKLNFDIGRNDVFIIMGGSGCGKSTLMKHLIGLYRPAAGKVLVHGESLWEASDARRAEIIRQFGISYQAGALISSLTLAENVAMPLELYSGLSAAEIRELVALKLSLVGLYGFEDYMPAELSGGMLKRAALARAIALDPEILFFDEPSAGLDPISARRLDDLIVTLSSSLGATIVIVTHELASILSIGTNAVFLDAETRTQLAVGEPKQLLAHCTDLRVQQFLRRGERRVPEETP